MKVEIIKAFGQNTPGIILDVQPAIAKIWVSTGRAKAWTKEVTADVVERAVAPTYEQR